MKFKLPPLQSNNCRLYTKVKNKPNFAWKLTQNLCDFMNELFIFTLSQQPLQELNVIKLCNDYVVICYSENMIRNRYFVL